MLSAARTASGISGRAFLHGDAKRRGSGQRVRGRQSNACERRPALQPQSFLQQSRHTLEPPSLLASQRVCPASRSGGRPPSSRLSSAGLAELRALAVLRAASARTRPKPVVPSSLSYARPLPASDAAAGGGGGDAGEAPTSAGSSSARGSAGGAGMGKGATGGRLVRWWKRRAGRCIASGRRAGGRRGSPLSAASSVAARPDSTAASRASTLPVAEPTAACARVISASVCARDSRRLRQQRAGEQAAA